LRSNGLAAGHCGGGARKPVKASVAQIAEIVSVKGPDPGSFETNNAVNLIVDEFLQVDLKDPLSGVTWFGYLSVSPTLPLLALLSAIESKKPLAAFFSTPRWAG
jgi:hypothetical protein